MDRLSLRPVEVAEKTGLGRSKVYELMATGNLPTVRIGRAVRVPADALRNWVAARTRDGAPTGNGTMR